MKALARLGPQGAAHVNYMALLMRECTEPDPRIDKLINDDPGHRWFCYCLSAIARSDTREVPE